MGFLELLTLESFERDYAGRHRLFDVIDHWAALKPAAPAIVNASRNTSLAWRDLAEGSRGLAGTLLAMGLRKGDFLATSLPLSNEHILLEYACFRAGIIHVPLDLRLSAEEVRRCLALVQARAFVHYAPSPEGLPGIEFVLDVAGLAGLIANPRPAALPAVDRHEGAQVIFTTGSTGAPKPALLSHRSITAQNLCLGTAFNFNPGQRVLVNLPASHVGCQSELLMTTLFGGGTAVTLEIFDAVKSLDAIEREKVTLLGQIPAMFSLMWRSAGYDSRDFSSLELAVYGGQAVPRAFLEKMRLMAPRLGTGLGLTETSGFCTYTPRTGDVDAVAASIGFAPPVYPMTIRGAMDSAGIAGQELRPGETGHVCFKGPQTFLGYVGDPAATARALSSDGWLYTGDLGYLDSTGLHFSGRAKWVIKPAGNQVFPGDVEEYLCRLSGKVASAGVVGVDHKIWSEAIVAFVEKRPGCELTEAELRRHARGLTSYMRPRHYVVVEPGGLPLNRVAKIDALKLSDWARDEVRKLRERGLWDGVEEQ